MLLMASPACLLKNKYHLFVGPALSGFPFYGGSRWESWVCRGVYTVGTTLGIRGEKRGGNTDLM